MRYVPIILATLAISGPALAQTAPPGLPGSGQSSPTVRQPAAGPNRPVVGVSRATAEFDRQVLEEQRRMDRIMNICTGC